MRFNQFAEKFLSHLYPLPFANFHFEILSLLEDPNERRIVILVPREHGKTTLLVGFVVWAMLTKRYHLILYLSQSQEQARNIATTIKLEFEQNLQILETYGNLAGSEWKSDNIELINGVRLIIRGITAGLRGLNIRGKRPDLIILDDVETDRHHYSAVESGKLKRIFYNSIMNLGKNAKIVVIGTMGGKHGLLYELSQKSDWKVIHYRAIENGKPLWETKWSIEDLERKRLEIGEIAFTREFLNEVVEQETIFKPVEFSEFPKFEYFTAGIDFATGKGQDWNAIVIVGWQGEYGYVVKSYRNKNPEVFIENVREIWNEFGFYAFAEANNFQTLLVQRLASLGIRVQPIKTTRGKYERFLEIQGKINSGLIRFHPSNHALLEEVRTYPFCKNDDLLDALYFAIQNKPSTVKLIW